MTALEAVNAAGQPARGNYVLFPASDQAIEQPERYTADPLLVSAGLAGHGKSSDGTLTQPTTAAVEKAQAFDLPDLSTPYRLPASAANAARTAAEASQAFAARDVSIDHSTGMRPSRQCRRPEGGAHSTSIRTTPGPVPGGCANTSDRRRVHEIAQPQRRAWRGRQLRPAVPARGDPALTQRLMRVCRSRCTTHALKVMGRSMVKPDPIG